MKKSKFFLWSGIIFDYCVIPALIFLFSFDPLFCHGSIVAQDEGQHLAWINSLFYGRVPYRNIYMFYGPLLEYIPLILMKCFGVSAAVLRAFYHFGMILGLVLAYFLGRMLLKSRFFSCIIALFLVSTKITPFWSARWGGPRLAVGIAALIFLLLFIRYRKRLWVYLAGLTSSIAFLTSQEIGLCTFFASYAFIVGWNIVVEQFNQKKVFRLVWIYSLGALTLILPFLLYLFFTLALKDYLKICFFDLLFRYPKIFVDSHPLIILMKGGLSNFQKAVLLNRAVFFFLSILVYAFGSGLLIFRMFRKRFKEDELLILVLVAFGGPLFLLSTRQLGGMQFNMVSPPIIILGCLLAERFFFQGWKDLVQVIEGFFLRYKIEAHRGRSNSSLRESQRGYGQRCIKKTTVGLGLFWQKEIVLRRVRIWAALGLTGFFFYFFEVSFLSNKEVILLPQRIKNYGKVTYLGLAHGMDSYITTKEWKAWYTGWSPLELDRVSGIYVPKEEAEVLSGVVNYLKGRLSPDEHIFVFPHEGQYYFLLDRLGPTRFDSLIYASISDEYQKEVIRDLEKSKVRYIIYVADSYVFRNFNKIPNEVRLNMVFDYIKKNYSGEARFGKTYILRRKP